MYRTRSVIAVLSALDVERWRYGSQLVAATGMAPGSISKVLIRLDAAGLAESKWEDADEARDLSTVSAWQRVREGCAGPRRNRQRRRYFRLTAAGAQLKADWCS